MRRTVAVLWVGHFLSAASLTLVAPLLPLYLGALGVATERSAVAWTGIAMSAPAFSYVLAAPLWGKLGDRFGLHWMVVRAGFGLSAVLALMGLAQSPAQLVLLRFGQGAFGGIVDSGTAYASALAPPSHRGRVLGVLVTASAAGAVLGPLVGSYFVDAVGFRPVLLTLALGVLVWTSVAFWSVSSGPRTASSPVPATGADLPLFRDGTVCRFLCAGVLANVGLHGMSPVLAGLVEEMAPSSTRTATWIGIVQATMGMAAVIGSPWWGRRNDVEPATRTFAIATAMCGVAMAMQLVPGGLPSLFVCRFLIGFCFSAVLQTVLLVVARASGDGTRGARMAITNSVLVVGQIVGALAASALAQVWRPVLVSAAMAAPLVASSLVVRNTTRRKLA